MSRIRRLSIGLLAVAALATSAPFVAGAGDDGPSREEWVRRYETLRSHEKELRESLEEARAEWSRGRRGNRLRGERRAELREEIEKLERDLEQAQRDLAAFPEKARKAGALPGWFRDDDRATAGPARGATH
jgi:hypothetical protein